MKSNITITIAVLLSFFSDDSFSQTTVNTIQPSIMVIPFAKEGEDIRTLIEDDVNKRIAITKVKEGFDERGFNTIDFRAKLKAVLSSQAVEMESQTSLKQQIIEMSGADIYVEVEVDAQTTSSGTSVRLILSAYDAFSAQSLSNKVGESGKFYTEDIGKLTSKAVENCIEPFLNTMNEKFGAIVENGRTVVVSIGFEQNSEFSMDKEVGEDELPLSDALELWFEENSYKNYYHIQGATATKLVLDDVRIPLKDPKTGNNYRATKFALKLYLYIKKELGLACKKDVNGTTIYIRIL